MSPSIEHSTIPVRNAQNAADFLPRERYDHLPERLGSSTWPVRLMRNHIFQIICGGFVVVGILAGAAVLGQRIGQKQLDASLANVHPNTTTITPPIVKVKETHTTNITASTRTVTKLSTLRFTDPAINSKYAATIWKTRTVPASAPATSTLSVICVMGTEYHYTDEGPQYPTNGFYPWPGGCRDLTPEENKKAEKEGKKFWAEYSKTAGPPVSKS